MLTKIIYKNFRSNLKNYILFFLSNIVASMELFVFRGLKEIVLQIVKDTETAFLFRIDFTVALGMISVITIMLMAYAMIYYLKSRIRDYGLFIMMGMHKRMVFSLMLIEYVLGWVFSSILGLILGTGILYGIQFLLHKIAPLYFVRIVTANLNIYVYSIKFSIGIMIFTFFAVIVWIENHNLSSLIQAEEKIQKCPQKGYWTIAVIIGIILSVIAWFMFPSYEEVHYDAYFIWIIGGFLILTFGMGVLLEEIKKHEQFFYLKNVLQINQFSSKYQNNLMLVLMFFVIHFFALTYISTEISSLLPIEHYKAKNYPYDMLWMANTSEQKYIDSLADKTKITEIPMMRVTSVSGDQQIGISESYYNKLTGKTLHLKNKQVPMIRVSTYYGANHIGISEKTYRKLSKSQALNLKENQIAVRIENSDAKQEDIKDSAYWEVYSTLYAGKYFGKQDSDTLIDVKENEDIHFNIQSICTQTIVGKYSTDGWHENIIVFSDEYFNKQWNAISLKNDNASELELFTFPTTRREPVCQKLKQYNQKSSYHKMGKLQNNLYITDQYLNGQKMRALFSMSSKIFLIIASILSGFFIMSLKTLTEFPALQKRFEFFKCMGMRENQLKWNTFFEIKILGRIAESVSLVTGILYVGAFIHKQKLAGGISNVFFKYWIILVVSYILLNEIIQEIFARYILRKLKEN